MAEWLSADFFQTAIAAARRIPNHADAGFRPIQSAFPDRAHEINNPAQREQNAETETEKQLSGEQLANEIELQDEQNRQTQKHALANLCFFYQRKYQRAQSSQDLFHVPRLTSLPIDAWGRPKGVAVSC